MTTRLNRDADFEKTLGEIKASLAKISSLLWEKRMGEIKANLALFSKAMGLQPTEEQSTTFPPQNNINKKTITPCRGDFEKQSYSLSTPENSPKSEEPGDKATTATPPTTVANGGWIAQDSLANTTEVSVKKTKVAIEPSRMQKADSRRKLKSVANSSKKHIECKNNSKRQQSMTVAKVRDVFKDNKRDVDMVEEKRRWLPADGERWGAKKKKRKRSFGATSSRSTNIDGELKQSRFNKFSMGSNLLPGNPLYEFKFEDSSGGNRLEFSPSPIGSTAQVSFKNEQEKLVISKDVFGGSIKERLLGKVNVKLNNCEENHIVTSSSIIKGRATRAPWSDSMAAANVPLVPGTLESWKQGQVANKNTYVGGPNNRKHHMPSQSYHAFNSSKYILYPRIHSGTISVFSSSDALIHKWKKQKLQSRDNHPNTEHGNCVSGVFKRRVQSLKTTIPNTDCMVKSSKEMDIVALGLSSHHLNMFSSLWAQSISFSYLPEDYVAIARLLFSRAKTSCPDALVRSFRLAISLWNVSVAADGGLPASRHRSLFRLLNPMNFVAAKVYDVIPIASRIQTTLTSKLNPFSCLVEDSKQQTSDTAAGPKILYVSLEFSDRSTLKCHSDREIFEALTTGTRSSLIIKTLDDIPLLKISAKWEQLLGECVHDDLGILPVSSKDLSLETATSRFLMEDDDIDEDVTTWIDKEVSRQQLSDSNLEDKVVLKTDGIVMKQDELNKREPRPIKCIKEGNGVDSHSWTKDI